MASGPTRAEGDRLGPYELARRLGRGGMGEVWEAVLHGPGGFRKAVALELLLPDRVADPEIQRSLLHADQGRIDEARSTYELALASCREVGDRRYEGGALGGLGNLARLLGQGEQARRCYEQAPAAPREVGDRRFEGNRHERRLDVALRLYEQAAVVARQGGDPHTEGVVMGRLALVRGLSGDQAGAERLLDRSEALLERVGDPGELARALSVRVELAHRAGRAADARAALARADVRRTLDRLHALLGG